MNWREIARRVVQPLRSRKVRSALTTVIVAWLAEYGFDASEQIVMTIVTVGVAVIVGTAVEDHGAKSAGYAAAQVFTLEGREAPAGHTGPLPDADTTTVPMPTSLVTFGKTSAVNKTNEQ